MMHFETHQFAFDLIRQIWVITCFINVCYILFAEYNGNHTKRLQEADAEMLVFILTIYDDGEYNIDFFSMG